MPTLYPSPLSTAYEDRGAYPRSKKCQLPYAFLLFFIAGVEKIERFMTPSALLVYLFNWLNFPYFETKGKKLFLIYQLTLKITCDESDDLAVCGVHHILF